MTEFISRKNGKEDYEIIIKTDIYEHYRTAVAFARRLIDHSTLVTNADLIRSMSDQGLATPLHDIGWDCHLCAEHGRLDNEPLLRSEKCDEKCVEHCLEWLKKPAEVNE